MCNASRLRSITGSSTAARSHTDADRLNRTSESRSARACPRCSGSTLLVTLSNSVLRRSLERTRSPAPTLHLRIAADSGSAKTSFTAADVSRYNKGQYRSPSRISSSASDAPGRPGRTGTGGGSSLSDRLAGRARPDSIRSSTRLLPRGTSRATGRPRSVTVIDSPAATRLTTADAFCFRARIPISTMFYNVAQVRGSAHSELTDSSGENRDHTFEVATCPHQAPKPTSRLLGTEGKLRRRTAAAREPTRWGATCLFHWPHAHDMIRP